jgi:rhodanese-related sulfurtransferase
MLLSGLAGCHALMPARSAEPVVTAAAKASTGATFASISVDDLRAMPAAQRPRLIDVREPDEYATGHVSGAINVPLATVAAWADQLAKEEPLLLICRTGRRSATASQTLVDKGFSRITTVVGGTAAWIQQGFPVVTGAQH